MKTFDQCKDEVANNEGIGRFPSLPFAHNTLWNRAAELYAQEVAERDRERMKISMPTGEVKAWDFVLWAKAHFESPIHQPNQEKP